MHVLRDPSQKLALGRSHRQVASSVGVSAGKVAGVFAEARALGLDAASIEAMSDVELDARFYPKAAPTCVRPEPDCAALHVELRRRRDARTASRRVPRGAPGRAAIYGALRSIREWQKRQSPVMRQVHVAGDKVFVDYAGMNRKLVDPETGEVVDAVERVQRSARRARTPARSPLRSRSSSPRVSSVAAAARDPHALKATITFVVERAGVASGDPRVVRQHRSA